VEGKRIDGAVGTNCRGKQRLKQTEAAKGETMKKPASKSGPNPSQLIAKQIAELGDWRGAIYARLRKLIIEAALDMTEEWKWGTAV